MGKQTSKNREPCAIDQLIQSKRKKSESMDFKYGEASEFYFACGDGNIQRVREILSRDDQSTIEKLNEIQPNGSTALHAATYYNRLEIVRFLFTLDCPRHTLNRYGKTAYEEARTEEMKHLYQREGIHYRFHDQEEISSMAVYLPKENDNRSTEDSSAESDYIQLFRDQKEVLQYNLNQETKAMWISFYDWFTKTFRRHLEREECRVDGFNLTNHIDFQKFLQDYLSPTDREKTNQYIEQSIVRNSIEPLITLYTSERIQFYRPVNRVLAQQTGTTVLPNSHLCDRYLMEFYLHKQQLKRRMITGTFYRGATLSKESINKYRIAYRSIPPGIIGLRTFTSTSRDPLIASTFCCMSEPTESRINVLFILNVHKPTTKIVGIEDISFFGHEAETLMLPGNLFTVNKIESTNSPDITKITLDQLYIPVSFWDKVKETYRAGQQPVL